MKILVIIVTYNGINWIERSLNSIKASSLQADVFVIDNGSTDGTQSYIVKNHPEVIFFQSKSNLGFGKANNIGLQYAINKNYDYVYLLNQDAWIYNNTLQILVDTSKSNPEYGILSPIQIQANEKHLDQNFNLVVSRCRELIDDLFRNELLSIYSVPSVMAAHWLITKDCLKKVGGFSPTFPHYGEDNNYTERALFHKFKVGIVPKAKAIHDREFRKPTIKKEKYMAYISLLILLSNISQNNKILPKKILKYFFYYINQFGISFCIHILIKLLCNIRTINKNKKISKRDCAFLLTSRQ